MEYTYFLKERRDIWSFSMHNPNHSYISGTSFWNINNCQTKFWEDVKSKRATCKWKPWLHNNSIWKHSFLLFFLLIIKQRARGMNDRTTDAHIFESHVLRSNRNSVLVEHSKRRKKFSLPRTEITSLDSTLRFLLFFLLSPNHISSFQASYYDIIP